MGAYSLVIIVFFYVYFFSFSGRAAVKEVDIKKAYELLKSNKTEELDNMLSKIGYDNLSDELYQCALYNGANIDVAAEWLLKNPNSIEASRWMSRLNIKLGVNLYKDSSQYESKSEEIEEFFGIAGQYQEYALHLQLEGKGFGLKERYNKKNLKLDIKLSYDAGIYSLYSAIIIEDDGQADDLMIAYRYFDMAFRMFQNGNFVSIGYGTWIVMRKWWTLFLLYEINPEFGSEDISYVCVEYQEIESLSESMIELHRSIGWVSSRAKALLGVGLAYYKLKVFLIKSTNFFPNELSEKDRDIKVEKVLKQARKCAKIIDPEKKDRYKKFKHFKDCVSNWQEQKYRDEARVIIEEYLMW